MRADGGVVDLTGEAKWVLPEKGLTLDNEAYFSGQSVGEYAARVQVAGLEASLPVQVASTDALPRRTRALLGAPTSAASESPVARATRRRIQSVTPMTGTFTRAADHVKRGRC